MLVNCAAYQNGKKLGDIRKEEIHDYLARPGCFVWVALKDATPEELAEMQQQFGLHELAVEDAQTSYHQRPKIEEYGDSLFAVIHTLEPAGEELRVGEVDIFVGRNYVLSVRKRTEQGFTNVRQRTEREPHLLKHGAAFVFYALIDTVVDRYFPVMEAVEDELEAVEARIFDGVAGRENIEALYCIKQKLTTLKHAIGPLHEAVGRLYGGRVPQVCAYTQEYFRDVGDHLFRMNQWIDSLRDTVITALSVNLSLITIQENETVKQLAAYAALVAVPTMIAGVYGMNFENMPELKWAYGYPFSLFLMVVIDIYLFWRFRKAKWI